MEKFLLQIIVFLVGAMGMVLELVGVRLMSPFFGTSLVIWTNSIGVVLGSLALGYYLGGKVGDTGKDLRPLSLILMGAGSSIAVIGLVKNSFMVFLSLFWKDVALSALLSSILIFFAPSVLFGMVLPLCVKRSLNTMKSAGETIGVLNALSTLGSIFGTFAAGFFLIPTFGTNSIFYSIAVLSVLLGIVVSKNQKKKNFGIGFWAFCLLVFSFLIDKQGGDSRLLIDKDSLYSRIQVIKGFDPNTKRPIVALVNGRGFQSAMFTDIDNDLVASYSNFFNLSGFYNPSIKSALMLGAGGYSYPKYFLRNNKESTMDVVEIDPVVTEVSKKYFGLKDDPRLTIHHEDARLFVNNNEKKYDVIFMDAFGSDLAVPYSLSTKEFVQKVFGSLSADGIAVVNVIASEKGPKSSVLYAHLNTYKTVFPELKVFKTRQEYPYEPQNFIMFASKQKGLFSKENKSAEYSFLLSMEYLPDPDRKSIILTDDFAPVEYISRNI